MPDRKRLVLRNGSHPGTSTVELDGEPLTFISRIEVVLDANGTAEARLTVPGALLDVDADVQAFVTAHAPSEDAESTGSPDVHVHVNGNTDPKALKAAILRAQARGPLPWRRA